MSTGEREGRGRGRARRQREDPIWTTPEPGARRAGHTREEIAGVAMVIADDEGFEAVSMRSVARALGSGTMTLYHYVRDKDDLLALMDDALIAEVLVPDDEFPEDWRDALTAIARRTRDAWQRHPWAIEAMRGVRIGPNGMRHFEQSLAATAGLDIPIDERLRIQTMVDDYTLGFSVRETLLDTMSDEEDWKPVMEYMQHLMETGDFPNVAEFMKGGIEETIERARATMADTDERFERGLSLLLDGIEQEVAKAGSATSRPAARSGRARGRSRGGGARRA
jgi:AcrR family transcriptional regulator